MFLEERFEMNWLLLLAIVAGLFWWVGTAGLAVATALVGGVMASVAVFFAVGGLPFWFVLAFAVGSAWYIEESEEDGALAVFPFILFCLFVHFISRFNLVHWGRENLGYLFARTWQYLLGGFVYSMTRWIRHLHQKRDEVDVLEGNFRLRYPFEGPLEKASESIRLGFTMFVLGSNYTPDLRGTRRRVRYDPAVNGVVPEFGPNALIWFRRFWWWPISLVGWVTNDLIREAWTHIKKFIRRLADGVAGLVFGRRAGYVLTGEDAEKAKAAASRVAGGLI